MTRLGEIISDEKRARRASEAQSGTGPDIKRDFRISQEKITLIDDFQPILWSRYINDSFILGHPVNGLLGMGKIVDNMEALGNWAKGGTCTARAIDNTHFIVGANAMQVTWVGDGITTAYIRDSTTAQGNWQAYTGVAAGTPTQGTFGFWVWIATADIADFDLASKGVSLGSGEFHRQRCDCRVYSSGTTYGNETYTLQNGWNYILCDLTSGDTIGNPDWTNVDWIQIYWGTPSGNGDAWIDYLTISESNFIGLNGLGDRRSDWVTIKNGEYMDEIEPDTLDIDDCGDTNKIFNWIESEDGLKPQPDVFAVRQMPRSMTLPLDLDASVNDYGLWTNSIAVGDVSAYSTDYIGMWVWVPHFYFCDPDSTVVNYRIGSAAGDYVGWNIDIDGLREKWNYLVFDCSNPDEDVGAIDWNNIDYQRMKIVHSTLGDCVFRMDGIEAIDSLDWTASEDGVTPYATRILKPDYSFAALFPIDVSDSDSIELQESDLRGDADLEAYYRLADATDELGGHNGVANNMAWVGGKFGNCGQFNGINSYIEITDWTEVGASWSELSVVGWCKFTDLATVRVIAAHYDDNSQRAWVMWIDANEKFNVYISDDGSDGATHIKNYVYNTALAVATWHQVSFTFDTGILTMYVNGSAVTPVKTTDAAITTIHNSTANLTIGSQLSTGAAAEFYTGEIDDVAIFSRVLTATEISELYDPTFATWLDITAMGDYSDYAGVSSGTPSSGYVGIRYYIPDVLKFERANTRLRFAIGSSETDFIEFDVDNFADGWNHTKFDMSSPDTEVGTPDWTSVDWRRIRVYESSAPEDTYIGLDYTRIGKTEGDV